MTLLKVGAEAKLDKEGNVVHKNRVKKGYRLEQIDEKLRKTRTRREVTLLQKARRAGVNVPAVIESSEFEIQMDFIDGKRVDEVLTEELSKKVGTEVAKLHKEGIIHGDLTTSNILVKNDEIYFIDFGLGESSTSVEKKAVDLRVLKESIRATKGERADKYIEAAMKGYGIKEVLDRLEQVEKRGRYKDR